MAEVKLTPEEEKELAQGRALYEMTQSVGFKVLEEILQNRAFHTWADPREAESERDWVWKELNSFWSAANARELLEEISQRISRADYLGRVKSGEIEKGPMAIR